MNAALRAERVKERLAAYKAKAPQRLAAAQARREERAAKRLKPPKVKRSSILSHKAWLKRQRARKTAKRSRRVNRA